jgi:hypothetical protein
MNEIATISKLEKIKLAIREVKTLEEIKRIVDQVQALNAYVKSAQESAEIQAEAAELLMWSTRRLGEFSAGLKKVVGGDRKSMYHSDTLKNAKGATLASVGVTRLKAKRAEKLAEIPEEEFVSKIEAAKAATQRITKSLFLPTEAQKKATENSQAQFRVEEYWRTGKKPKGWIDGSDDELYRKAKESAARHEAGQNELAERKTEAAQYQDDPVPAQFEKDLAGLDTDTHRIVVGNSVMKICRSTLAKARK